MANTTWNPSDKSANITLTGSNLIATSTSISLGDVRAIDKQITGKFYWECTYTTVTSLSSGAGIFSPGFLFATGGFATAGAIGTCGLVRSGSVYSDGSPSISIDGVTGSIAFGTITNGTVVCIAVNIAARLIWFRLGAAGNWNNVAGRDPASGVGGVSIGLGFGIPVIPAASLATTSDQITANFGDTAFTGTVPSGFTSGFTAGVTSPTNALATQIAAEHWITTSPPAQVTQVALEMWAVNSAAGGGGSTTDVRVMVLA